jgi:hypothetical protein
MRASMEYKDAAATCDLSKCWRSGISADALFAEHLQSTWSAWQALLLRFGSPAVARSSLQQLQLSVSGVSGGFQNAQSRCYMNALWFLLQRMPCFRTELQRSFDAATAAAAAGAAQPHSLRTHVRRVGPLWHIAMQYADFAANLIDNPETGQPLYDLAQNLVLRTYSLRSEFAWFGFRPNVHNGVTQALDQVVQSDVPGDSFDCFTLTLLIEDRCSTSGCVSPLLVYQERRVSECSMFVHARAVYIDTAFYPPLLLVLCVE